MMFYLWEILLLITIVLGQKTPMAFIGPTANQKTIANKTCDILKHPEEWPTVLSRVKSSGGAFHVRQNVFTQMTTSQMVTFANNVQQLKLQISIEGGGYMCRPSGATMANTILKKLQPFFQAGGTIHFWLIESVFSRTRAGCANYTLKDTVREVSAYAGVIASKLPSTKLYLYDALPHYSVGKEWPPNEPLKPGQWAMDLPEILKLLAPAMASQGAKLLGYWADCPYEYSIHYTHGNGYKRLAAAFSAVKELGLQFGKTFNSQLGGQTSDELFYNNTLDDFKRSMLAVNVSLFDMTMVETWYAYPLNAIPETQLYTTMYTAKAVMQQ